MIDTNNNSNSNNSNNDDNKNYNDKDVIFYDIDFNSESCFDNDQKKFNELYDFVDNLTKEESTEKTVVFVQEKAINEFNLDRYNQLRNSLRYEEFNKLFRFECLLSKLSTKKINWIYVLNNDCIGPFFSFVLSCDKVVSFNIKAQVGFDLKDSGYLPPIGGNLEKLDLFTSIIEKFSPTFSSYFAYKKELFEYCGFYKDWKNNFYKFLNINNNTEKKEISISKKEETIFLKKLDKKFLKFFNFYKIKNLFSKEQISAWSFFNEYIRAKFKTFSNIMKLGIISYLNARQLYSFGFKSFLKERINLQKMILQNQTMYLNKDLSISEEKNISRIVYIDLNYILPPLVPIIKLIKAGYNIVFFSRSNQILANLIDLFFLRLNNQALDLDLEKSFIYEKINWFVGDILYKDGFILRWVSNEEIAILYKDEKEYIFNSIYKKDSMYLPNWCEFECKVNTLDKVSSLLDRKINSLISIMVRPPIFARTVNGLCLSIFIRSWFLEQLIFYSKELKIDILFLLSILEESGWGFVSSDICWDKFLINRQEKIISSNINLDSDKIELDNEKLDQEILCMNVWKEVELYCSEYKNQNKKKISTQEINIHFVNKAKYITFLISKNGYTTSLYQASELVRECLGMTDSSRYYLEKTEVFSK